MRREPAHHWIPRVVAAAAAVLLVIASAACGVIPQSSPSGDGRVHQIVSPKMGSTFQASIPDGPDLSIVVGGGQRGSAAASGRANLEGDVIDLFLSYKPTGTVAREALPAAWKAVAGDEVIGNVEVSVPQLSGGQLTSATVEFSGVPSGQPVQIRYEDGNDVLFTMDVAP